MHLFFHIFGLSVPGYGLMIVTGVFVANIAGYFLVRKDGRDFYDLLLLEAYGILGAFVGAKLLYLIVSFRSIDWSRITEWSYFSELMEGGFVFYGGILCAFAIVIVMGRVHKVDTAYYLKRVAFLIPLGHAFGRVGCYNAGCCYGIPYDGPGAIVFPRLSFAPSGIPLFPVQLTEAACLLAIAVIGLIFQQTKGLRYSLEGYLLSYGVVRFGTEFLRYDAAERGIFGPLSTSQWISAGMIVLSLYLLLRRRAAEKAAV